MAETDYLRDHEPKDAALAERVRSEMLERSEHRHLVLTLRRRGLSFAQISQALLSEHNVEKSPEACRDTVRRYLEKAAKEDAESAVELRQLENERLDELLMVFGPKARAGDQKAAAMVLKISERRAKMNGLDAAVVHEHRGNVSVLHELGVDPEEIRREREAFETAFTDQGLADPGDDVIEHVGDAPELPAAVGE
jgi:hypothetical protein